MTPIPWPSAQPQELSDHVANDYRSKGERLIAEALDQRGVTYHYEAPAAVIDRGLLRLWYPDFTIRPDLILEYAGLAGDPSYDQRMAYKQDVYARHGVQMLVVTPDELTRKDWADRLVDRIEHALAAPDGPSAGLDPFSKAK